MAITTFADIYSGVAQQFNFTKTATTGSSAADPVFTFAWSGFPGAGSSGSGLSGSLRDNTSSGALPFKDPASGQNTYLSSLDYSGTGLTSGRSVLVVDLLWITSALSQVTTTQTINSITLPSRDMDGSTNGRGVYIAMWHTAAYSTSNAYTATITYTNSANAGSRTGSVSRTGGNAFRFVPFSLAEGDEGVKSVQNFTFSAVPGAGGTTLLIAYRPIAVVSSGFSNSSAPLSERAFTLGLPRIYDGSCVSFVNLAGENATTSGHCLFSQG